MSGAVAGGEARQARNDFDMRASNGEVDGDEIVRSPRRENAVGCGEGSESDSSQSRRNADQILLGHAELKETIGEIPRANVDVGVFGEVGRQADDVGATLSDLDQRLAKRLFNRFRLVYGVRETHCLGEAAFGLCTTHGADFSNSLNARSHSWASTRTKWALGRVSRNRTPFPIRVVQTTTFGWSKTSRAVCRAWTNSSIEFPSTACTCQRRRAMGSALPSPNLRPVAVGSGSLS